MTKFKTWLNQKAIPTIGKLGNQRHLSAIRDAFAIFTPILILGALAVLWRSVMFNVWGGKGTLSGLFVKFDDYTPAGEYATFLSVMGQWMLYIQVGIINSMSLYVAFGLGYFISLSRGNKTPVIAGLVTLASFLAVTNMMITGTWESGMYWLGARGLISAIIISLLMGELFSWLSNNDKLAIKMPAGVPPAVSRAFARMFPAMITIVAAAGMGWLIWLPYYLNGHTDWLTEGVSNTRTLKFTGAGAQAQGLVDSVNGAMGAAAPTLHTTKDLASGINIGDKADVYSQIAKYIAAHSLDTKVAWTTVSADIPLHGGITFTSAIYAWVVAPFIGFASKPEAGLGIALLYVLLISFFWFFGLHGTNIVNGAFSPIWLILLANNIAGADNVFVAGTFDAYIFIGGWGATLALVVATLIFGKRDSQSYEVSKFALAPGLFQINEPVTFGYPLVLNGFLLVPLMLVMPILTFTTFAGIRWFHVPVTTVMIPWTAPIGIGGFLANASPWGFVLAVANFGIAIAIWTPFVFVMRKADANALVKKAAKSEEGKKVAAKKASAKKATVKAGK